MTPTCLACVACVAGTLVTPAAQGFAGQIAATGRVSVRDAQISPDGRWIVFARGEDPPDPAVRVRVNLWRVPFAGGDPQPLTTTFTEDSRPRWSSDGRQIAFLSAPLRSRAFKRIFIMPSAGGVALPISPESADVVGFEWSPDRRRIAFVSGRSSSPGLWIVDVRSNRARAVSMAGASVAALSWAPGSTSVAAVVEGSTRGARLAIVSTARPTPPRFIPGDITLPVSWSRDGSTIAVLGQAAPGSSRVVLVPAVGGAVREFSFFGGGAVDVSWTGDGRLSLSLVRGADTWIELLTPATGDRTTVMPHGIATLTSAPSWSGDGSRYAVVGGGPDHAPEVFAGTIPLPESGAPDRVGARPPPVRRLTISNPG